MYDDEVDNGLIGDEISVNLSNEVIMKTALVTIQDERRNKEIVAKHVIGHWGQEVLYNIGEG